MEQLGFQVLFFASLVIVKERDLQVDLLLEQMFGKSAFFLWKL